MSSRSEDDGDETDASGTTKESSTSATSEQSQQSERPRRNRKRKRNDDSIFEELSARCKEKSKAKSSKKTDNKPKEKGVKPNPQSALQRKASIAEAARIKALLERSQQKSQSSKSDKSEQQMKRTDKGSESFGKTVSKSSKTINDNPSAFSTPKEHTKSQPLNISAIPGGSKDNMLGETSNSSFLKVLEEDMTPRKKKMLQEIEKLRRQVAGKAQETDNMQVGDVQHYSPKSHDEIYHNDTLVDKLYENTDGADQDVTLDAAQNKDDASTPTRPKRKHRRKKSKKSKKKKSRKSRKSSKKSKKHRRRSSSTSSSSSSSTSSSTSSSRSSSSDKFDRKAMMKRNQRLIKYDQLLHSKSSSDVEEIVKGSGVYMNATALARVLGPASKSHSSAARMLCRGVFKEEALRECSVMGMPAKAPQGKPAVQRPPLCPLALQAIHTAARDVAKSKRFKIRDETDINKELGTLQSELRKQFKLQQNQPEPA